MKNGPVTPLSLELLVEVAPDGACLGHIPSLPGFSFRSVSPEELHRSAKSKVREYARWLSEAKLSRLNATVSQVLDLLESGRDREIQVIERERRDGWRPWISGNPAVLFGGDRRALPDDEVVCHLRFLLSAVSCIRSLVGTLTPTERMRKPAPERRSIDETLTHIGNCVWWYCSRIDDSLPEPEEIPQEDALDRIERLREAASGFLLSVPFAARSLVHVPTRFCTLDAEEPWTHTKVCRRQTEHAWDHLLGAKRAVEKARNTAD